MLYNNYYGTLSSSIFFFFFTYIYIVNLQPSNEDWTFSCYIPLVTSVIWGPDQLASHHSAVRYRACTCNPAQSSCKGFHLRKNFPFRMCTELRARQTRDIFCGILYGIDHIRITAGIRMGLDTRCTCIIIIVLVLVLM